jgi:uncharacterized protein (TIGR02453 family)
MIEKTTLDFLKKLTKNNNRDWFEKNREDYLKAKTDVEAFTEQLIKSIAKFHPEIGLLNAKNCVFRIFRDVRFSKDKSPYKTNMGAYISEGGKKGNKAGYYLHIQPNGQSFLAGGMYMPEPALLNAIRQEIDYNTDEFKGIINKKSFKNTFGGLEGEKLKAVPKGYDKNHPDIELLKYKSYIVWHKLDDKALTQKDFLKKATAVFKELYPFNQFLNRANFRAAVILSFYIIHSYIVTTL